MAGPSNNWIVAMAVTVVVAGMAIASLLEGPTVTPQAEPSAASAPKLSAQHVAKCAEVLAAGMKSGVIRARPAPNRIDVDDGLWAMTDARTKDGVLAALACDVWHQAVPPPGEFVVSYGWRSGKRIEMYSELGVDRE